LPQMYGIYNSMRKEFQFGICEPTKLRAEKKLIEKIGKDAYKWRFEAKLLPKVKEVAPINNMKCVAVIGSQKPTAIQESICREFVSDLVNRGFGIKTGCCKGIDQIAMDEANKINPNVVFVVLPWGSYERQAIKKGNKVEIYNPKIHTEWTESVYRYHPYATTLKQGTFKLQARNYGIVHDVVAALAFPSNKPNYGGTGQGMRIAQGLAKRLKAFDYAGREILIGFSEIDKEESN